MQRFDLAAVPPTPWKNGGSATRELACWPPGADMEGFEWRVSVASIAAPGPFSAFAGVDRQIMLLEGDGVRLRARDGGLDHALNQRWQPLAFPGELAIGCSLLGGACTDFNLMLRRGRWRGDIQVVRDARLPGGTGAGLCMVLAGRWAWGDETLTPGQGLWWSSAEAGFALTPQEVREGDGDEAAVLAWVALMPCT